MDKVTVALDGRNGVASRYEPKARGGGGGRGGASLSLTPCPQPASRKTPTWSSSTQVSELQQFVCLALEMVHAPLPPQPGEVYTIAAYNLRSAPLFTSRPAVSLSRAGLSKDRSQHEQQPDGRHDRTPSRPRARHSTPGKGGELTGKASARSGGQRDDQQLAAGRHASTDRTPSRSRHPTPHPPGDRTPVMSPGKVKAGQKDGGESWPHG